MRRILNLSMLFLAISFFWQSSAQNGGDVLPITFEDGQLPVFNDFNGSATLAIANPDASGANTSATVAQNTVPANAGFAGVNFPLDTNIDITVDKFFTLKVWSPVANMPVLLKLENASGANAEVAATTTTTNAWETISFDFSAVGQLTYESVTLFMNFDVVDPADQTYYWDDLELVNEIVVTNDLCENAIAIDCGATLIGDTSDFSSLGAPEEDCVTSLNTAPGAWHTVTIPADGDYTVTVDTFNSAFDTKLGIFSGSCDALVCVGGNDDAGGGVLQSEVTFVGTASETYTIYVTGFGLNAGEYDLNVACELVTTDCNPVTGITISDITEDSAVVSWEDEATALDGYAVGVFLPGSDPAVDEPVYGGAFLPAGTLTDTATGLSSNTMYEAFVVSVCNLEQELYVFSDGVPFTTIELGLADATIEGFTFYPNPSSDVINLTATENIETVAIYNLLGQKVIDQNINATSSQLDVANLVTGTYLMEVSADGKTAWHKVIKK